MNAAIRRYDFWATAGRVVSTVAETLNYRMNEEEGERHSPAFVAGIVAGFWQVVAAVYAALDGAQWLFRATFGTAFLAIAEAILPPDLKTDDDIPFATVAPEKPPEGESTFEPVAFVEVAQTVSHELETASPEEVPHAKEGKRKYRRVDNPEPGMTYWYKRGKRYFELRCPILLAA